MARNVNAEIEALRAELAAAKAEAEAAKASAAVAYAKSADRLQLNGWLTVPHQQRQELAGKSFTCTVTLRGTFRVSEKSKSGNVSAVLTHKVPFTDLVFDKPADVPTA